MDNSRFGTASKEWTDYAAAHPELDINSDGFNDSDFASPEALRDSANTIKETTSQALFALDDLGSKVTITKHRVPTRDGSSIELRAYRPAGVDAGRPLPAYLYYHGGGMLFGTANGEDYACATWAHRLAADPVVVLHACYRHTPEHAHPRQHEDAWDAFEWVLAQAQASPAELGVDPSRIVIGGVSAGAGLAASVVVREVAAARRESRGLRVRAQLLIIPWIVHRDAYPMEMFADPSRASLVQCDSSPTLPRPRYNLFTDLCRVEDCRDPLMNVGLVAEEDIRGAPRTVIVATGWDMLRDEAFIYGEKLERLGCPIKKHIFPGLPHAFRKYPDLPSSKRWDELTLESIQWCLNDKAEGHTPGDWKVEVPEQYR